MLLQKIIDHIPCPILYKDVEGRYLLANRKWCENIIGLPVSEIINRTGFDLPGQIPLELTETCHRQDVALLKQGGVQIYEAKVKCIDGHLRDFMFHKAVYRNDRGHPAGIVGVMLDVTDLRRTGFEDCFTKPVPLATLLKAAERAFEKLEDC